MPLVSAVSTWASVGVPVMAGPPEGASLTGSTFKVAVSVALLKAVVPPLTDTFTPVWPLPPLVWSQARNLRSPTGPL
jgi:hypothetical protein